MKILADLNRVRHSEINNFTTESGYLYGLECLCHRYLLEPAVNNDPAFGHRKLFCIKIAEYRGSPYPDTAHRGFDVDLIRIGLTDKARCINKKPL